MKVAHKNYLFSYRINKYMVLNTDTETDIEELEGKWVNAQQLYERLEEVYERAQLTAKKDMVLRILQIVVDEAITETFLEDVVFADPSHIQLFMIDDEPYYKDIRDELPDHISVREFDRYYKKIPQTQKYYANKSFETNLEWTAEAIAGDYKSGSTLGTNKNKKRLREVLENPRFSFARGDVIIIRGNFFMYEGDGDWKKIRVA